MDMTILREHIVVPRDIASAFKYTADFSNIENWDPGVAKSEKRDDTPVGLGSEFDLLVTFGSSRIPMTYTITEFDPPNRVVLVGKGEKLDAVDTITFSPTDSGTRIDYVAELTFHNFVRFVEPLLGRTFKEVGEKAVSGLGRALEHDV
jgi:carbon monoxide dehydrogenase subunit G